jgi:lycopene cyclase domain-containing protein
LDHPIADAPSVTYLQFHLAFTVPVLVALALIQRRPLAGVGARLSLGWLAAVVAMAVAYTTPWDNYLVYRGVWTYPPGAVVGTIGYVPVEEYAFFVIQTVIAGLFYFALRGRHALDAPGEPTPRPFKGVMVGAFLALTALGFGLLIGPSDHALYLGLILAWAPPVLAGMAFVGADKVWAERRRVAATVAAVTLYLWTIDRVAIGLGIWAIAAPYRLGVDPLGLPVEEAVFFLVTTTLCVSGLALFLPTARSTQP